MSISIVEFLLPLVFLLLLQRLLRVVQLQRSSRGNPNLLGFFRPGYLVAVALGLPQSKPFNIQLSQTFRAHFDWFRELKSTVISVTSIFPADNVIYVGDPETAVVLMSTEFEDSIIAPNLEFNNIVDVWGKTVLSSDGDSWKRQRRVASASFSKGNIYLVWDEVRRVIVDGWFPQLERDSDARGSVLVSDVGKLTLAVGLNAISAAAFGQRVEWNDTTVPDGYKLPFAAALEGCLVGLVKKSVLPKWLLGHTQLCYEELERYVKDSMIAQRRAENQKGVEHEDLFARLLKANDQETKSAKQLTYEELLGNIFLFIVAGHETSARNMSFALCMMALFPEAQEKIYAEALACIPSDLHEPTTYHEAMHQLPYTRAAVNETLRMWPSVILMRRRVVADAVVPCHHISDTPGAPLEPSTFKLNKGDFLHFDVAALHYNPYCWGEDVFEFKPERFLDMEKVHKGAFMPFGNSSRICLGRDFAMTEMICFLATTIRHYKIDFAPERHSEVLMKEGETQRQRLERILSTSIPVTLVHQKVGLRFTKRKD